MRTQVFVAAALAVVIAAAAIGFWVIPLSRGTTSTTTCPQCFRQEPIVDILSPVLGNSTSTSNQNRTIEMQAGTSNVFEIDVYPTFGVNMTMGFRSVLVYSTSGGAGALPSASFQPMYLSLSANTKGVTYLTLQVPQSAAKGTYDSVVLATNNSDNSEVWGLYFQVVVK